jgi:hypothetical protein
MNSTAPRLALRHFDVLWAWASSPVKVGGRESARGLSDCGMSRSIDAWIEAAYTADIRGM